MDDRIIKYILGELDSGKRRALFRHIEEDKEVKAEFIGLQNLQALSHLFSHPTDRAEGMKKLQSFALEAKRRSRKRAVVAMLKYAVAVAILVASAVSVTLYLYDGTASTCFNTLHVPAGQRARIALHDGTEVWLNAQSTLKYPSRFSGKNRKVEMIGEAFFHVAENPKKPFVVSTQNVEMRVLGTQFNVYSYQDAGYVQTDLVEGAVKIYKTSDKKNAVILKPDQQLVIRDNRMIVSDIRNSEHLLWKEGIYSFRNEPLIDIIEKLELYYDVKIVVENPEMFNVPYTGKFRQRDGIDEILHIIRKIQPFEIHKNREKNTITIKK